MRNAETLLRVYQELAERFTRQNEPRFRDHCLVLAADAALSTGQPKEAEQLRQLLLKANPHHLLRPFASMAEAMQASDVQDYVADLRRQWPSEMVQKLYLSGDTPAAEAPVIAPRMPKTEVTRQTEPGTKEAPAPPPRVVQAWQPPPVTETPPRRPAVVRPPPLPMATPVAAPTAATRPAVIRPAPAPTASTNPLGPVLATLLLLVGIAAGLGVFFLAFVWPLLH